MNKNSWVVRATFALFVLLPFSDRPVLASGSAASLVEEFNTTLITVVRTADRRLQERYDMLAQPVERAFNLPFMLQETAGTRWRGANEDERAKLIAAFTRISIGTFLFRFREYEGESFKVLGEAEGADETRLVHTEFVRPGRPTVPVTYVTRQFGAGWRIVDLLIGGSMSELAMRRSEYAYILRQSGIGGLIARLNEKADQMLAGVTSSGSAGASR
jgi:phospholipid transport system substrate-binding protein